MATYTDLYTVLMSFSAPKCRAQIGEFIHNAPRKDLQKGLTGPWFMARSCLSHARGRPLDKQCGTEACATRTGPRYLRMPRQPDLLKVNDTALGRRVTLPSG